MNAEIKFCGMTQAEDADFAVSLGAAYVGVIFAGGSRNLTEPEAMTVLAVVPRSVERVGVFADQSADHIVRLADHLQLGVVQLHGDHSLKRIAEIRRDFSGRIWTVARLAGDALPPEMPEMMAASDGLLLDAKTPGALGGTGVALPWASLSEQLHEIRGSTSIILAGGLRPENVRQAIAILSPDVVDVSSGVETAPGLKSHDRMRAFRDAVDHASTPT